MKISPGSIAVIACVSLTAFAATPSQANPETVAPNAAKVLNHALDADLITAVTAGNAARVRELLTQGADPNTKDPGFLKGTALTAAATYYGGTVEIVQALVEAGADLEGQNGDGETPLTLAVMGNHVELMEYLIKAGANLESSSFHETTPLMSAVFLSNAETVRVLLAAGANVNARFSDNKTALIYACKNTVAGNASLEIVKLLVNAGADVSIRGNDGKVAHEIAADNQLFDINHYLVDIYNRDATLHNAINKAYRERKTADLDARLANWQAVKTAVASGANARSDGVDNAATSLIFLMTDLPDADDATVQTIIARSDLNAQEPQFGNTALHTAVSSNNAKFVGWLIKAGANINIRNKKNQTPLDLALENNFQNVIPLLKAAGATDNPLLVTEQGWTKLMLLVIEKPFDAARAEMLVKAGVDVDATTDKIYTALMFACDSSSPEAVKFLLQNNANVNFIAADGKTALMYAARHKTGADVLAIVQQLIAAKADVNAKDNQGNTALSLARESSNIEAADALRKAGADDVEWG